MRNPTPELPERSDSDLVPALKPPAPSPAATAQPTIRVLVSSCLLGEQVRYDGQHKRDAYLVETLARFVEIERVCPEVDCGMPVPRPSMHLVGSPERPRLIASRTGADLTEQMERFAREKVRELEKVELCGYVCKKDSPSSGMERVKVYDARGGAPRRVGSGIFTRAFMERFPHIPVEDEGRLHDDGLRDNFIARVFCLSRWHELERGGRTRGRLVEFHADHKYLLLAHGRARYEALGRLVAHAKELRTEELYRRYLEGFTEALRTPPSPGRVTDVLSHMMGFFRPHLSAGDKQELLSLIDSYRRGLVPLVAPLTLVRHYVRKFELAYLERQVFLSPYPAELMLRNRP